MALSIGIFFCPRFLTNKRLTEMPRFCPAPVNFCRSRSKDLQALRLKKEKPTKQNEAEKGFNMNNVMTLSAVGDMLDVSAGRTSLNVKLAHRLRAAVNIASLCLALGIASTVFGTPVSSRPASTGTEDVVSVQYAWQRGDTLSQVLYRSGLGRSRGVHSLYGATGWIAKNVAYSRRLEVDWRNLTKGEMVELRMPASFAINFRDAADHNARPNGTYDDPSEPEPLPGKHVALDDDLANDGPFERTHDIGSSDGLGSGTTVISHRERAVSAIPTTIISGTDAGAPNATQRAPATRDAELLVTRATGTLKTASEPALIIAQTKEDHASKSVSLPEHKPDAAPPELPNAPTVPAAENPSSTMVDVTFGLMLLAAMATLSLHWRRRNATLDAALQISANAYLASLVIEPGESLPAPELFEAVMAMTKRGHAMKLYERLGHFAADRQWLIDLTAKIEGKASELRWEWRRDSAQHATMARFAADETSIFCEILATASSLTLCRAALGRFVRSVREQDEKTHRQTVLATLEVFQEILGRKKSLALQSQVQEAIEEIKNVSGTSDITPPTRADGHAPLTTTFDVNPPQRGAKGFTEGISTPSPRPNRNNLAAPTPKDRGIILGAKTDSTQSDRAKFEQPVGPEKRSSSPLS